MRDSFLWRRGSWLRLRLAMRKFLLERTDGVLDGLRGVIKKGAGAAQQVVSSEAEKTAAPNLPKFKRGFQQAANILKPQRAFANPPDNFAAGPWKPLLTSKPHAKVPLEQSLRTEDSLDGTGRQIYRHPYQTEIEEYKFPPSVYIRQDPIPYQPYDTTTATLVDTEEAMLEMLEELKKAKEIAIDLEHHDQRTYVGIVCLMQISTRDRDWIIDTLKPWRRRLECLNEVFADPSILKVLHGSAMDVIWLQRDLGLYLVGVFDTEHAATALRYPKRSLAYLLEKHVNFQAQKQYQLADWRVRPLSQELFDYARSDTHFLLYIYDCLRNELIDSSNVGQPDGDLLDYVLRESKRYGLQRYENPFYDAENGLGPMGWYRQLIRTPALLSKQQFSVFRAVHQWRDNMARKEDESLFYVMSNHLLQTIAREMPVTKENLLAATPANAHIVRQYADQLVAVIAEAKERGEDGPEMRDVLARSDQKADQQHNSRIAARDAITAAIKTKIAATEADQPVAVLPSSVLSRPIAVDLDAVKSDSSSFWGSTLASVTQARRMTTTPDVKLTLPMPEVSADVFAPNATTPAKSEIRPMSPETPKTPPATESQALVQAPPPAEPNDVFVLREKGGKRSKKRKAQEPERQGDELKAGLDEVGIFNEKDQGGKKKAKAQDQRRNESIELKKTSVHGQTEGFLSALKGSSVPAPNAAQSQTTSAPMSKKQIKRDKKGDKASGFMAALMGSSAQAEKDAEAEEEPFDYANAPSVLNTAAIESGKKKGKKGKMDGFDPYKKALDTKKGVPKGQRERTGMSGTFKS
ncbi:hypothetical protein, variant [Verruconis gallopava]|uniref:HRDC domain-containing protein n=1 Tax=Verruconis gallopava TaxID=253628 RepID=A0A0D2A121_9PEZI|nr:hypothetical protein, variant [Verruconis gallopava]KIW00363.1 hypothetical protein, variant [Verruconis gallopava]